MPDRNATTATDDRRPSTAGNTPEPAPVPNDHPDAPSVSGLFERHSWLVPVTAVAAIFAAFALMIALTALAGGSVGFG